jgi:hypothetical protein
MIFPHMGAKIETVDGCAIIYTFATCQINKSKHSDGKRTERAYHEKGKLLAMVSGPGYQGRYGRKLRRTRMYGYQTLRVRYMGENTTPA